MRRTVALAAIEDGPWESAGPSGVEILTLNLDADTGARTALIRSVPRDGVEHKAQYHECEEEFFCLQGRFTFDGSTWMRPCSYACYPPHVVHGARVSVPGGYLLYLRTSGSTRPYTVAAPARHDAYHHTDFPASGSIVVRESPLDDLAEHPSEGASAGRVRQHVLRTDPASGATVTLWEFGTGSRDLLSHFPAAQSVEVLTVFGQLASDPERGLQHQTYGFYGPQDERPVVQAHSPVFALVHSGGWA